MDTRLPYAISVGTVRSGDWASSVPDLLTAEGRMGVRLGEDPAEARDALEVAVAEASAADPWLCDHPPSGDVARRPVRLGPAAPGARARRGGGRRRRGTDRCRPVEAAAPYGSDLRLYVGQGGIPTLQYGPGDVRLAHAPRESVPLGEVVHVARTLALLAARRLGAH